MAKGDSTFSVHVEVRTFPKGGETVEIEEKYETWAEADTAYKAYESLTRLPTSCIKHVDFVEHRKEIIHKFATKRKPEVLEHTSTVRWLTANGG